VQLLLVLNNFTGVILEASNKNKIAYEKKHPSLHPDIFVFAYFSD